MPPVRITPQSAQKMWGPNVDGTESRNPDKKHSRFQTDGTEERSRVPLECDRCVSSGGSHLLAPSLALVESLTETLRDWRDRPADYVHCRRAFGFLSNEKSIYLVNRFQPVSKIFETGCNSWRLVGYNLVF